MLSVHPTQAIKILHIIYIKIYYRLYSDFLCFFKPCRGYPLNPSGRHSHDLFIFRAIRDPLIGFVSKHSKNP